LSCVQIIQNNWENIYKLIIKILYIKTSTKKKEKKKRKKEKEKMKQDSLAHKGLPLIVSK